MTKPCGMKKSNLCHQPQAGQIAPGLAGPPPYIIRDSHTSRSPNMNTPKLIEYFQEHWDSTIKKCELLLEPADNDEVQALRTWDAVQHKIFANDPNTKIPHQIVSLQPVLAHLATFTSFFQSKLGIPLDAGFLWGVIGLLLQVTVTTPDALVKIPRMLKSIGHRAEVFNNLCSAAPILYKQMREPCFEIQTLLVEFFVEATQIMRGDLEGPRYTEEHPWMRLERRFMELNQELVDSLNRVEKIFEITSRIATPNQDQSSLVSTGKDIEQKLRCLVLPQTKTPRFFNRLDIFTKIDRVLGRTPTGTTFRSIALYGLGGIGKSSIAARYVELKLEDDVFDSVFWVHGEKTASLRQSFTDIAIKLNLPGAHPQNHDENLTLVHGWFQSTTTRWLVVYDNVESADLLMPYWPIASHGSAIITTRNHTLGFNPASAGLEVHSWDSTTGSEFLLFLLKKNIGKDIDGERHSAFELSKILSGHALAINQMASLIQKRSWSVSEFMTIYLRNRRRAHNSEIEALWDISFTSLGKHGEKDSHTLLGIVSFLMPDDIPEALFKVDDEVENLPEELEFCGDEFSFSDAVESLLTGALIQRNRDTKVLSIHRMVQTQFKYFLSREQRQKAFDLATFLLYKVFPQEDETTHQLYEKWAICNQYLQHVLYLKDFFKEEMKSSKEFKATGNFCELLKGCQRYLYEANQLTDLEDLCEANILAVATLENKSHKQDLMAHIYSQQSNLYESIGKVELAIELNLKAYALRQSEVPLKPILLAGFENNLGYNYNTANQHETALEWFSKSRDRWFAWELSQGNEANWPAFLKKNMGRCLVYLNRFSEARSLLQLSLKEFRSVKPLNWAMIAYGYFALGVLERRERNSEVAEAHFIEAQNLWLKGDQTRLHPFNGGCMYKMGVCCLEQGKVEAAIKHLRDSMVVTNFHRELMPVEHARNMFKLSEALLQADHGSDDEAEDLRDDAEVFLRRRDANIEETSTEDAYDKFVPIFWR
ncbi:hypothetical protein TWF481_006087 [Arthrobotrys musiformis]|uniref:NB-ARC domain-containing protein n=1 Tax=Arthrobotrys musiformis TaxID=47236 RepID=A0AAV9WG93_9PEZI